MVRRAFLSSILVLFAFAFMPRSSAGVATAGSAGCSVTCGAGYYACCNKFFGDCKCAPDAEDRSCDSGGKGSTSCTLGSASAASALSPVQSVNLNAFIATLEENPGTLVVPQQAAWQKFLDSLELSTEP